MKKKKARKSERQPQVKRQIEPALPRATIQDQQPLSEHMLDLKKQLADDPCARRAVTEIVKHMKGQRR